MNLSRDVIAACVIVLGQSSSLAQTLDLPTANPIRRPGIEALTRSLDAERVALDKAAPSPRRDAHRNARAAAAALLARSAKEPSMALMGLTLGLRRAPIDLAIDAGGSRSDVARLLGVAGEESSDADRLLRDALAPAVRAMGAANAWGEHVPVDVAALRLVMSNATLPDGDAGPRDALLDLIALGMQDPAYAPSSHALAALLLDASVFATPEAPRWLTPESVQRLRASYSGAIESLGASESSHDTAARAMATLRRLRALASICAKASEMKGAGAPIRTALDVAVRADASTDELLDDRLVLVERMLRALTEPAPEDSSVSRPLRPAMRALDVARRDQTEGVINACARAIGRAASPTDPGLLAALVAGEDLLKEMQLLERAGQALVAPGATRTKDPPLDPVLEKLADDFTDLGKRLARAGDARQPVIDDLHALAVQTSAYRSVDEEDALRADPDAWSVVCADPAIFLRTLDGAREAWRRDRLARPTQTPTGAPAMRLVLFARASSLLLDAATCADDSRTSILDHHPAWETTPESRAFLRWSFPERVKDLTQALVDGRDDDAARLLAMIESSHAGGHLLGRLTRFIGPTIRTIDDPALDAVSQLAFGGPVADDSIAASRDDLAQVCLAALDGASSRERDAQAARDRLNASARRALIRLSEPITEH